MERDRFRAVSTDALTRMDVDATALWLGVEAAALWAVIDVETNGRGFRDDGLLVMRFEAHIFRQRSGWSASAVNGNPNSYATLETAMAINEQAALESASWGLPQIMGFNYAACGVDGAAALVERMRQGERQQLGLMGKFLKSSTSMADAIRSRRWADFARSYNGPGYRQNRYDEKLAVAYAVRSQAQPARDGAGRETSGALTRLLRAGSRGTDVLDLQKRLNRAGGALPLFEDGIFGAGTEDRVIEFQKAHGFAADGIVGNITWAKLQELTP